ncbi:hypothetical protein [Ramlibacter tataouinensis]|uniref:Uncharacterized protein n=1 Tax=Ramlibacter tataouinensis (strain ATCC BAA-407 / DSM 14655 / LMG 21543 / TTB310) TaxID=365046 RepID=F5XW91_RAMTT|nr:hypothetical protein [Ramlibacter tataouinensis]AEG91661.1 Hypothetical protein Rta_05830 [Ramlibacter tataouinensis TTB310]
MYYAIEAIHWAPGGHISHVRWYRVSAGNEGVQRSGPEVVPVVDAARVCESHEVRVYVEGDAGRFFRMKACPEGIDAVADEAGTPLKARLAHLPTFELDEAVQR